MRDHECDSVVVVDPAGNIVAMLTARDICLAALRSNRPLSDLRVEQGMSRTLHTGGPGDTDRVLELIRYIRSTSAPPAKPSTASLELSCSTPSRARRAGSRI